MRLTIVNYQYDTHGSLPGIVPEQLLFGYFLIAGVAAVYFDLFNPITLLSVLLLIALAFTFSYHRPLTLSPFFLILFFFTLLAPLSYCSPRDLILIIPYLFILLCLYCLSLFELNLKRSLFFALLTLNLVNFLFMIFQTPAIENSKKLGPLTIHIRYFEHYSFAFSGYSALLLLLLALFYNAGLPKDLPCRRPRTVKAKSAPEPGAV